MSTIIGRKQETEELERLYNSDRPETNKFFAKKLIQRSNTDEDLQKVVT